MRNALIIVIVCILAGCRSTRTASASLLAESAGRLSVAQASVDSIVKVSLIQMTGELSLEEPEITVSADSVRQVLTLKARRADVTVKTSVADSTARGSRLEDNAILTDTNVVHSDLFEHKKVEHPSVGRVVIVILLIFPLLSVARFFKK